MAGIHIIELTGSMIAGSPFCPFSPLEPSTCKHKNICLKHTHTHSKQSLQIILYTIYSSKLLSQHYVFPAISRHSSLYLSGTPELSCVVKFTVKSLESVILCSL